MKCVQDGVPVATYRPLDGVNGGRKKEKGEPGKRRKGSIEEGQGRGSHSDGIPEAQRCKGGKNAGFRMNGRIIWPGVS